MSNSVTNVNIQYEKRSATISSQIVAESLNVTSVTTYALVTRRNMKVYNKVANCSGWDIHGFHVTSISQSDSYKLVGGRINDDIHTPW